MRCKHLALLIAFFACPFALMADFSMDLDTGWTFRQAGQPALWLPATVPGTVHTDLLANKLIPDPFYSNNESKLQWIETKTWEYTMTFECTRAMRKEKHIELQFEGLDTYADVYLNDSLLFTAEDMFLSYTKDVKEFLKKKNVLRIVFRPASELIAKNKNLSKIKNYPGGDRVFIRKAQYQFGWDWGPRFVTSGIWKPVRLIGWRDFRVSDVSYTVDRIEDGTAYLACEYRITVDKPGTFTYFISDRDTQYKVTTDVLKKGTYGCFILFSVPNARLWWCNGLGKPNLYEFTFTVKRRKKEVSFKTVTGLRTIQLSRQIPGDPESFYFILNDVPVFAQGSNWIPSDNFLPRINNNKVGLQLSDMHDLNMNMVRVWGGGIYESDYFYSQCDSLGLMVWQDLPFACSMYPLGVLDMNTVLTMEIVDNMYRVQNHPSLALWCADNENMEGWFNWGWQKQMGYSKADSTFIFNEYLKYEATFHDLLSSVPVAFTPTSPLHGWGRKEAYTDGDVHYWGVWWGMEPLSSYETHTGRFVSEFGMQAVPGAYTIKDMGARPNYFSWWNDTILNAHQKHPTGFNTLNTYIKNEYGIVAGSFDEYIYLSQVLQRDALTTAIEAQRRNYPTCMGSLFWQYNDCWPVTSWSVQDYYGRKKLSWYALKRLYQPVLSSVVVSGDSIYAWITNNSRDDIDGTLRVNWTSFTGKSYYGDTTTIHVPATSSMCYWKGTKSGLASLLPVSDGFFDVNFFSNNQWTESTRLFEKVIDCNLPAEFFNVSFVRYIKEGPCSFVLSSGVFLHNVMLTCNDPGAEFSANGFDILPGQSIRVEVKTNDAGLVENSLKVTTMNGVVQKARPRKQKNDKKDD